MKIFGHSLLYWSPRMLAVSLLALVSSYALLSERAGGWSLPGDLLRLVPVVLAAPLLAALWRHALAGALVFGAFGAWWVWVFLPQPPPRDYLLVIGPSFLIGLLFLLDWRIGTAAESSETTSGRGSPPPERRKSPRIEH